jgi:type IV pilus assembly protein PilN
MIKINLLPYREMLKRQKAIIQLIVGGIVLILLLVVIVIADRAISARLVELENQISSTQKDIAALNKRTAEIYQFEKDQKEFQNKLDKIEQLNRGRKLPVRILDEVSKATPEKLWMTQLTRTDNSLVLNGIALDQETIVSFLHNLEKSDYFSDIRLIQTQQFSHQNLKLQRFNIRANIQMPPTKEKSPPSAGGKKLG